MKIFISPDVVELDMAQLPDIPPRGILMQGAVYLIRGVFSNDGDPLKKSFCDVMRMYSDLAANQLQKVLGERLIDVAWHEEAFPDGLFGIDHWDTHMSSLWQYKAVSIKIGLTDVKLSLMRYGRDLAIKPYLLGDSWWQIAGGAIFGEIEASVDFMSLFFLRIEQEWKLDGVEINISQKFSLMRKCTPLIDWRYDVQDVVHEMYGELSADRDNLKIVGYYHEQPIYAQLRITSSKYPEGSELRKSWIQSNIVYENGVMRAQDNHHVIPCSLVFSVESRGKSAQFTEDENDIDYFQEQRTLYDPLRNIISGLQEYKCLPSP